MVKTTVQRNLEQALEEAHTVCSLEGDSSPACAARWDVVEELQAALAHHRAKQPKGSTFEEYCEQHPDSFECRIYDV